MPNPLTRIRSWLSGSTAKRSYDAAAGGRRWHRQPTITNPVEAIQAARTPIAYRARAVVANDPLASSGVMAWTTAVVGTGMKAQSSHPRAAIRTKLNLAFEQWCNEADADGMQDFYGLQLLMFTRTVIDGEAIAVMDNADGRLKLRVLNSDQLATEVTVHNGNTVVAGIEFNASGSRVAYHIRKQPLGIAPMVFTADIERVPTEDVIHLLRIDVPGQIRGLSWFSPVILRLRDLSQWRDSQLVRQKIAAMMTGFVRGSVNYQPEPGEDLPDMQPGAMIRLAGDDDVSFSTPPGVGQEVMSFAKFTAEEIAAGLGVPYALLTGDLGQATYGSARVGSIAFNRRVETVQHGILAFQMLRPVWKRWATLEVLSGRVRSKPEDAIGATFVPARAQWLDPKSDAIAVATEISHGLISRREALAARGMDIERVDETIAADNARADKLGLQFGPIANDNSPPAASDAA